MSKARKLFNQSKTRQLLNEAINHQEFLNDLPMLVLEGNQLYGVVTVDPRERNEILELLGDGKFNPSYVYENEVRPVFMQPKKFIWNDIDEAFHYDVGYSVKFGKNNEINECLSSALFLRNDNDHFPIGFFKFSIENSQEEPNFHYININLEHIYIDLDHRNRTNWLDLTCAIRNFLTVMLECIVNCANESDQLNFYLNAKFESDGGEKIGNLLFREIRYVLEELQISYPQKAEGIKPLIAKMC